jgi:hypothetical protein
VISDQSKTTNKPNNFRQTQRTNPTTSGKPNSEMCDNSDYPCGHEGCYLEDHSKMCRSPDCEWGWHHSPDDCRDVTPWTGFNWPAGGGGSKNDESESVDNWLNAQQAPNSPVSTEDIATNLHNPNNCKESSVGPINASPTKRKCCAFIDGSNNKKTAVVH